MAKKSTAAKKATPAAKPVVKKDLPGIKTDIGGQQPNPGADVGTAQGNENPGNDNPSIKNPEFEPEQTKTPNVPESENDVEVAKPSEDVAPEPEPYDHTGKIKITDVEYDKVDAKHLKKLVKESHINAHYKENLNRQIKAGKISPEYVHMVRMIISANDQGSVYSGTLEG